MTWLSRTDSIYPASSIMSSFNYSSIGSSNYGSHWRNVRRIATSEVLSHQQLMASDEIRAQEVLDLARRLFLSWKDDDSKELRLNNGYRRVELKTIFFGFILNSMMTMIAGKQFYGDNIEDLEEMKKFKQAVEENFSLAGASNIEDFVPVLRMLDLNGVMKKKQQLGKKDDEIIQTLINEHRKNEDEFKMKKTMIAGLFELQKKNPDGYKDHNIKGICLSLLHAGTDTSANTVEWAMSLLLNNPGALKKVTDEIDKFVGNKHLINESDMTNLPYLHCILSEVLRLYPGAPLLVPHESRESISIGGYEIPQGTMLLVNIYYMHRDANTWQDPTEFRPERFENGQAEGKWMLPFGMGRRRCPGERLAIRSVSLILGTMIQCFDWGKIGDELVDLTEDSGLTLLKVVPLEALYRPRETMLNILSTL